MKKESKSTKDTGHSFADYFKRALNPLLVLLLLSEQPMYVYEMMREISKRSDGRYTISLLYPVIQRLLSQGYVCEGQKAISDDNRVRQYYACPLTVAQYHFGERVIKERFDKICTFILVLMVRKK